MNRMVVDHRPRALAILGVAQEEKEELMPHFLVRIFAILKRMKCEKLNLRFFFTIFPFVDVEVW